MPKEKYPVGPFYRVGVFVPLVVSVPPFIGYPCPYMPSKASKCARNNPIPILLSGERSKWRIADRIGRDYFFGVF
jgi:hypothetical protein